MTGDWAGGTSMPLLDEIDRFAKPETFKVKTDDPSRPGVEFLDGAKSYSKLWRVWDGEAKYHNHCD